MILADVLSISINLLLVAHVVISLLLILVVMMQRPKQEGLGAAFGGGVTDQMFGAQTTNVLQKGTVYLATLFVVLSLVLAILIGNKNHQTTIDVPTPAAVEEIPAVPEVVPGGGSIKDELDKGTSEGAAPAGGATTPAEDATTPAEGATTPAEGATTPAEGAGAPVEDGAVPSEAPAPAGDEAPAAGDAAAPGSGTPEDKPE